MLPQSLPPGKDATALFIDGWVVTVATAQVVVRIQLDLSGGGFAQAAVVNATAETVNSSGLATGSGVLWADGLAVVVGALEVAPLPDVATLSYRVQRMTSLHDVGRLRAVASFGLPFPGNQGGGFLATRLTEGLSSPSSIAYSVLPRPSLYVSDTGNHRVMQLELRADSCLKYRAHFGESGYSGSDFSHLHTPLSLTVGDGYLVYVLDSGNSRIMVLSVGRVLGTLVYFRHLSLVAATSSAAFFGPGFLALTASPSPGAWLACTMEVATGAARVPLLLRLPFGEAAHWSLAQPTLDRGAVVSLSFDFELLQGSLRPISTLSPTAAGTSDLPPVTSLSLTSVPALVWDLAPHAALGPRLAVPPFCEADVKIAGGREVSVPCEYRSVAPGARFSAVLLPLSWLEDVAAVQFSAAFIVDLPQDGVAPSAVVYGLWEVSLHLPVADRSWSTAPVLRSIPLVMPTGAVSLIGTLPRPQLVTAPFVVPPMQARLAQSVTVDVLFSVGALLLGDGRLPALVRLVLPDGFVLGHEPAASPPASLAAPLPDGLYCEPEAENSSACIIQLLDGIRLRGDLVYSLRLEGVRTPRMLELSGRGAWVIDVSNSGTSRSFRGASEQDGVPFVYGKRIPRSWAFFPYVSATPLSVGYAVTTLRFRPYVPLVVAVVVLAPEGIKFPVKCEDFEMVPVTSVARCGGSDSRIFSLRFEDDAIFDVWTTYIVRLGVVHTLMVRAPEEGSTLISQVSARAWQLKFLNMDGFQLAYTDEVLGYPIWPAAVVFDSLSFLSRAPAPLAPASLQLILVRFTPQVFFGLGSGVATLRLYAPKGFTLDCGTLETSRTFRTRLVEDQLHAELPAQSFSCYDALPSGLPHMVVLLNASMVVSGSASSDAFVVTLAAGGHYGFELVVTAPFRPGEDRGSIIAEEQSRMWYISIHDGIAADLAAAAGEHGGGGLRADAAVRHLDVAVAIGASIFGAAVPLWVLLTPQTLLSTLDLGGSGSVIEFMVPGGGRYSFVEPCSVEAAFSTSSGTSPLPGGTRCQVLTGGFGVQLLLPFGAVLEAEKAFSFIVRSLLLPSAAFDSAARRLADIDASRLPGLEALPLGRNDAERRMAAATDWRIATRRADGSVVDEYFPPDGAADGTRALLLVPRLASFAFAAEFSSQDSRRLGSSYVAAFIFAPPPAFSTPISFLQLSAPTGFAFAADEDCSPDSTDAMKPVVIAEEIDRVLLVATEHLLPGWCEASPTTSLRPLLGPWDAGLDGGLAEQLFETSRGLQSAFLSLLKELSNFEDRYMFRVVVQHPDRRLLEGDNSWSLSLFAADQELIAQDAGLTAYQLVGDLEGALEPSNRVLSSISRQERSIVGISLRVTTPTPLGSQLLLRLGGGPGVDQAYAFVDNVSCGFEPGQAVGAVQKSSAAELLPLGSAVVGCSSALGELRVALAGALTPGVWYTFWVQVINPLQRPSEASSSMWALKTIGPDGTTVLDANEEIPNFDIVDAPLPLLAVYTWPSQVLADRTASVLLFFALPSGELLARGSKLWVQAPRSFRLPAGPEGACRPVVEGSSRGIAAVPSDLVLAAAQVWGSIQHSQVLHGRLPVPVPPFTDCKAAEEFGVDTVTLTLPMRLRGGELFLLALDVACPSQTPAASDNIWRLQVLREVNFEFRIVFDLPAPGFPLIPKLQQESVTPFRSLSDAYVKQSQMLPEAASFVNMHVEFAVPFLEGQLRDLLEVMVEAPDGFIVGAVGASGTRTCSMVELQIGRLPFPIEGWAVCDIVSTSVARLVVKAPEAGIVDSEATVMIGQRSRFLRLMLEAFPLLPPSSLANLDQLKWNIFVSACSGALELGPPWANCSLVAASTKLPTWGMFGYLHLDGLGVTYPSSVTGPEVPQAAVSVAPWAQDRLLVLHFQGVRVSMRLPVGSSLRVVAKPGYEFLGIGEGAVVPFNSSSLQSTNLPALDLAKCQVRRGAHLAQSGEVLELYFVEALDGDALFDLIVAVRSPSVSAVSMGTGVGADSLNLIRVETRSPEQEVLDVQRDVGQWQHTLPFAFALLAAGIVGVPGDVFSLAIFVRMPEHGLGTLATTDQDAEVGTVAPRHLATSLQVLAPPNFQFGPCDGRTRDNARLAAVPSVPSLQDPRILPALLRPLPANSACTSHGSTLTIALGGRRRGSGRGTLSSHATYAFSWSVMVVVGLQLPFRPRPLSGAAGSGVADLAVGDEPSTPEALLGQRDRWTIAALRGQRQIFAATVEERFESRGFSEQADGLCGLASSPSTAAFGQLRLEVRDLSPVWMFSSTPYFGERSLLYVVFSVGRRAYPASARLRISMQALDPLGGHVSEFLSCQEQLALFRRRAWTDPINYFSRPDGYWSSQQELGSESSEPSADDSLQVVNAASCEFDEIPTAALAGGKPVDGGENGTDFASASLAFEDLLKARRDATSLRLTLALQTTIAPPAKQLLLVLSVKHLPSNTTVIDAGLRRDVLILEILEGESRRVISRSHDLALYPVTRRMVLSTWAYASTHTSAANWLDLEFLPSTALTTTLIVPRTLGFALIAPVLFRFTQTSCSALQVSRTKTEFNVMLGANETRQIYFRAPPSCEVAKSEWLAEGGYYQHQLVIYLPALVEIDPTLHYQLKVMVVNPPFPTTSAIFRRMTAGRDSPKFSASPYLAPVLNAWRLFSFVWDAGDAGGNGAPVVGAAASADLGRVAGVRKVDEVVWEGFDVDDT